MHHLVLGGDYKKIRQIIGTVSTRVSRNPHNPTGYLDEVAVRISEGTRSCCRLYALANCVYARTNCGIHHCTDPAAGGFDGKDTDAILINMQETSFPSTGRRSLTTRNFVLFHAPIQPRHTQAFWPPEECRWIYSNLTDLN